MKEDRTERADAISSAGVVAARDHFFRFLAEIPEPRRMEFIRSIENIVTGCFEDALLYHTVAVEKALAGVATEAACEN